MTDAGITKRLIISGLTPAITAEDVKSRLSSFGSVKAVDGFGLVDSLGQPRKFGFVTLETTPSKLGKCMNVLSGAVWKGTKLRLGEAKPDYRERIARENQEAAQEPPKKRRRRHAAVHAADMSLVTPENAVQRPGWKVSPLGRITHPMRIRPPHPLTSLQDDAATTNLHIKKAREGVKKKKRVKVPDTRARRLIDMTKWGSTHLKGSFLDSVIVSPGTPRHDAELMDVDGESDNSSDSGDEKTTKQDIDLGHEKKETINFLASLFGKTTNDEDDWIGRESIGSDIDAERLVKGDAPLTDEDPGFEEVPKARDVLLQEREGDPLGAHQAVKPDSARKTDTATSTKLKDLFAPKEEAGFSLLDHLDIEFEVNDDLPFLNEIESPNEITPPHEPHHHPPVAPTPIITQPQASLPRVTIGPKEALFFPLVQSDSFELGKVRPRDLYDVARENGWYWRDPSVRFWNTESEEEVRKRWEDAKGELTRSWKQRWREARKGKRRKRFPMTGDEQL